MGIFRLMACVAVVVFVVVHAQHTLHAHLSIVMMMRYVWNYKQQQRSC
mgnify:CR=1 FL=1